MAHVIPKLGGSRKTDRTLLCLRVYTWRAARQGRLGMALRSSLPSTLNSQINTGPSINTTVRTGMNLAKTSGSCVTQVDLTNSTKHDIPEEHILLTECDTHDVAQMQTCIGKDTVPYGKTKDAFTECKEADTTFGYPCEDPNPNTAAQYLLDLRYSQYLRDIGDARNDLEYFLRINQVCLFIHGINAEVMQPHLADTHSSNADELTTRRVNILFCNNDEFNDGTTKTIADWDRNIEPNTQTEYYEARKKPKILYRFAVVQRDARHLTSAAAVQAFILGLLQQHNIEPFVSKGANTTDVMRPVTLAYAGMSLTYGHMSAKNGDTALTTNLFSARTNRNGPFRAHGGDDAFWLYNCELAMFHKDTHRRIDRFVLTPYILTQIMQAFATNERMPRIPTLPVIPASLRMRPDPIGDGPGSGNKEYPPFVFGVGPHTHSLLPWNMRGMSLRDIERKMGKVVSGGTPSAQVDWVNGAGSEL